MHNFNTSDISNFYRSLEPDVKQATINWRVYHLVSKVSWSEEGVEYTRLAELLFLFPI